MRGMTQETEKEHLVWLQESRDSEISYTPREDSIIKKEAALGTSNDPNIPNSRKSSLTLAMKKSLVTLKFLVE
jgi:hypothetical protein